jgi:hypothetical protein
MMQLAAEWLITQEGIRKYALLSMSSEARAITSFKVDCEMVTRRACDDEWLLRNPGLEDGGL